MLSYGNILPVIGTSQLPPEMDDGRQFARDIWNDVFPEITAFSLALIGILGFGLIIKSLRGN